MSNVHLRGVCWLMALLALGCEETNEQSSTSPGDASLAEGAVGAAQAGDGGRGSDPEWLDGGALPAGDAPTVLDAALAVDGGSAAHDGSAPPSPPAQRAFFLPTGEPRNTAAPKLELDARGRLHAAYSGYGSGGVFYATCEGASCDPEHIEVVQLSADNTAGNVMLTLTKEGAPRLLFATFISTYYAECDADCGQSASWRMGKIVELGANLDVTGESLALDPQGRPRFLQHGRYTPGNFFDPPVRDTSLASCERDCTRPESWRFDVIAKDEIWRSGSLRFDAQGAAHVAAVLFPFGERATRPAPLGVYKRCTSACESAASWQTFGLRTALFVSGSGITSIDSAISLALTGDGQPRVAMLSVDEQKQRELSYFECLGGSCFEPVSWQGTVVHSGDDLYAGVDLALDPSDHPHVVFSRNFDIGLAQCSDARCAGADSRWHAQPVELSTSLTADAIFLRWNCTVGAWFFRDASLALDARGQPVVGYRAADVSGGVSRPDDTRPACRAGTDMTWARIAFR